MKLTEKQTKTIEEINVNKLTAQSALTIALTFFTNMGNEISRREKILWDELAEVHNLDPNKDYELFKADGSIVIVEIKKDKNDH